MSADRRYAVVAGVLFVVATVASLSSGPLLASLDDPDYLVGVAAHDIQVQAGALLTFVAALAAPGIAIALYPVLRRFGRGRALGAVVFRTVEGVIYALSALLALSLVSLSQDFVEAGGPDQPHYRTLGDTVLVTRDWMGDVGLLLAFSLGALLYYSVFYRARLVPRWLSVWGIAAALLLMLAAVLVAFQVVAPLSVGQVLLAVPIGLQEMVLAVWLIARGFSPAAVESRAEVPRQAQPAP